MTDTIRHAKRFVVLDLDRTLLKSDDFFHDSLNAVVDSGIIDKVSARRIACDVKMSRGMDTDWVGMIASVSKYSVTTVTQAIDRQLALKDSSIYFYNGVRELLEWLHARKIPHLMLTKGSVDTQGLKLAIVDRTFPHPIPSLITNAPSKAAWIADTIRTIGQYIALPEGFNQPNLLVEKVYIIDDKLQHTQSDNAAIIGIHIDNSLHPSSGAIPIAQLISLLDGE